MTDIDDNDDLDAAVVAFDATQGERLFYNVHRFLGRFVVYPSSHAQVAHTLWIGHTYLMPIDPSALIPVA